mmetsp:Transcript_79376/g.242879  ORF Transcript_79376/g.242879 Transcript_79376/m.242879 type:complete len:286 (+) Transcript_79376:138-995(+)
MPGFGRRRRCCCFSLRSASATGLKNTGPPAAEASTVTHPAVLPDTAGRFSWPLAPSSAFSWSARRMIVDVTGMRTIPSGSDTEGPACSTTSPRCSVATSPLFNSSTSRTMTPLPSLPPGQTTRQRGTLARTRNFGPPAFVASAVTQPDGRTGRRMQPLAMPCVSVRAWPACWTSSPGDTFRKDALRSETPSRTSNSSPNWLCTRHHDLGLPFHEAGPVASPCSPSEMYSSSSSAPLAPPPRPWPRRLFCTGSSGNLQKRVSTTLRFVISSGLSASATPPRHIRRW